MRSHALILVMLVLLVGCNRRSGVAPRLTGNSNFDAIVHYGDGHTLRVLTAEMEHKFGDSDNKPVGTTLYQPTIVANEAIYVDDQRGEVTMPLELPFADIASIQWKYEFDSYFPENANLKQHASIRLKNGKIIDKPTINYDKLTSKKYAFGGESELQGRVDGSGKFAMKMNFGELWFGPDMSFKSFNSPTAHRDAAEWLKNNQNQLITKIEFVPNK